MGKKLLALILSVGVIGPAYGMRLKSLFQRGINKIKGTQTYQKHAGQNLIDAVSTENKSQVEKILKDQAVKDFSLVIDAVNQDGETSLMIAIKKENLDLVRLLVKKGAHLNAQDRNKKTPLMLAFETKNQQIINYLNQFRDVSYDMIDNKGRNVFHYAVEYGDASIISDRISYDYIINDTSSGISPLALAISKGNFEILQVFKQIVNKKNSESFDRLV